MNEKMNETTARMEAREKAELEKSIPEMADEMAHTTMRHLTKGGRLTAEGRKLAKVMEKVMPDDKVDEWGWDLSRKERAAIKRRAAEKKAAEEKKKAEARARAAYRRKQRKFEENGLLEGFAQINWSFMAARDELKRRGFSLELMHKLKGDVVARISPWNKQHHADYVE